jgi:hypothetical protein
MPDHPTALPYINEEGSVHPKNISFTPIEKPKEPENTK